MVRFITKKSILVCFSLILFSVIAFVSVGGNKASAAVVYQGPCNLSKDGHFELNPKYTIEGKTYDCVRDTIAGDWFAKPPDGCPFGAPGYKVPGYGPACLWYEKIDVGDAGGGFSVKSDCNSSSLDANNCGIIKYLLIFINALSAMVAIVVILMIIIGGIQYSAAGNDPQKVQEARKKISNALLALAVFIFMYAFLQWVVPGGIF